ncbi:glycosyltransferase [Actinosynnema sp. NPDC047251]|nr:glycosyltransferase [Saccharothrix espanaensis]
MVIPARDEEASLAGTIRSCRARSYPIDQIIVVADTPPDRTAGIARGMGWS